MPCGGCLEQVDILIINDGEARALGEDSNLVKVAQNSTRAWAQAPHHQAGEYGVLMFNEKSGVRGSGLSA